MAHQKSLTLGLIALLGLGVMSFQAGAQVDLTGARDIVDPCEKGWFIENHPSVDEDLAEASTQVGLTGLRPADPCRKGWVGGSFYPVVKDELAEASPQAVDLSGKKGVVDPADLKKDDPPEPSLHTTEPPAPPSTGGNGNGGNGGGGGGGGDDPHPGSGGVRYAPPEVPVPEPVPH
jgi:hypothetical protein